MALFAGCSCGGNLDGVLTGSDACGGGEEEAVAGGVRCDNEAAGSAVREIHAAAGGVEEKVEGFRERGEFGGFARAEFITGLGYGEGLNGGVSAGEEERGGYKKVAERDHGMGRGMGKASSDEAEH